MRGREVRTSAGQCKAVGQTSLSAWQSTLQSVSLRGASGLQGGVRSSVTLCHDALRFDRYALRIARVGREFVCPPLVALSFPSTSCSSVNPPARRSSSTDACTGTRAHAPPHSTVECLRAQSPFTRLQLPLVPFAQPRPRHARSHPRSPCKDIFLVHTTHTLCALRPPPSSPRPQPASPRSTPSRTRTVTRRTLAVTTTTTSSPVVAATNMPLPRAG